MTGSIDRVEVITSVQRRRRWSAEEKARIVQETYAPGMSVTLVARQDGVAPNQVFKWGQLHAAGALSAVGAGEEVVPASEYRALRTKFGNCSPLGKKTLENEAVRDALELAQPKNGSCARLRRRHGVKTISDTLGVARSNLAVQAAPERSRRRRGRYAPPEAELVAKITTLFLVNRPTATGVSMPCCGGSAANKALRQ